MNKRRRQKVILFGAVLLALGLSATTVSAQQTTDSSTTTVKTADGSQSEKPRFALNEKDESSGQTGLKWVGAEKSTSRNTASGSSDATTPTEAESSSRDAEEERTQATGRTEEGESDSEKAREDSEFESLATAGRGRDVAAGDRSLGMETDSGNEQRGGDSFDATATADVQFGEKSVEEVVDLYRESLVKCYRNHAATRSDATGALSLEFVIGEDGEVRSARIADSTLNDAATESCMVETIRSAEFPAPGDGGSTTWTIPFQFGT